MQTTTTDKLGRMYWEDDANGRSIMPTGALKVEGGVLYQEATIIIHRGPGQGMKKEWIPADPRIAEAIRSS
jgi:hypothetical protein